MPPVRFSLKAKNEIGELIRFIAEENPVRAFAFTHKLTARCAMLKRWPLQGRSRPEFGATVRSIAMPPVVVFYRYDGLAREVVILRVIDGRRDLGTVFFSPLAA